MIWQHRKLASAAELEDVPPSLSAAQAQAWSNFIVWQPESLPAGCDISESTVRKEAPPGRVGEALAGRSPWTDANPTAYRFIVRGNERSLRVKQFLYDWAFPALDHPCLWESSTHAVPLPSRDVVWLGTDYSQRPGASARLSRTMIELSVLEGQFAESELVKFVASLRPVSPVAAESIAATRFSALSYWARYDTSGPGVPIGLWQFEGSRPGTRQEWADDPAALAVEYQLPSTLGGFRLDDAASVAAEGIREVEAVYVAPSSRGRELRLIAQRAGNGRLRVPSQPSTHPANREILERNGKRVQLGWIDSGCGPFDAVWSSSLMDYKLLSTTGAGLDLAWFKAAVAQLD